MKRLNILGINAHERCVSGCRIETEDNKIIVQDNYLWVGQQLDHVSHMVEQITIDFDIRNLCIIKHEKTKGIIEYVSNGWWNNKVQEVSESDFKNKVGLVRTIQEKIVAKDIVFTDKTRKVEEFFEEFSSSASFFNIVEKNKEETSFVWAFILACSVVLK